MHPALSLSNQRSEMRSNVFALLGAHFANLQLALANEDERINAIVCTAHNARVFVDSWLADQLHARSESKAPATSASSTGTDYQWPIPDMTSQSSWAESNTRPTPSAARLVAAAQPFLGPTSQASASSPNMNLDDALTNVQTPALLACTVCSKESKTVYDWKRHEAQHYRPWKCMPNGSHIVDGCCVICGEANVSDVHKNMHYKLEACLAKPLSKRSFRGRDKLMEHLRVHLGPQLESNLPPAFKERRKILIDHWESDTGLSLEALWCGFCESYCDAWTERQEHILQHLKEGENGSRWQPMP
jgi:hypothetical protein